MNLAKYKAMEWSDLPANTNLLRSVNNVLEFGKHKGRTVHEVIREDPNWLHWALRTIPTFKLNKNALLLLPPCTQADEPRRGTIEDGAGGYLDNDKPDVDLFGGYAPETFNDYD
jgi:uncharacterized protein (DUF3820 family)